MMMLLGLMLVQIFHQAIFASEILSVDQGGVTTSTGKRNICDAMKSVKKMSSSDGIEFSRDQHTLTLRNFYDNPVEYWSESPQRIYSYINRNAPIARYTKDKNIIILSRRNYHAVIELNNSNKTWKAVSLDYSHSMTTIDGDIINSMFSSAAVYNNEIFLSAAFYDGVKSTYHRLVLYKDLDDGTSISTGWKRGADLSYSSRKPGSTIQLIDQKPHLVVSGRGELSYIELNSLKANDQSAWKTVNMNVNRRYYPVFLRAKDSLYIAGGHYFEDFENSAEKITTEKNQLTIDGKNLVQC